MKRGFLLRCDSTIWFTSRGEKKNIWNEAQGTRKRSLSKIKSAKHTKRKKNLRLLVEIFMAVVGAEGFAGRLLETERLCVRQGRTKIDL